MIIKLNDRDDIRRYLNGTKVTKLKLNLERAPFEIDPTEGTFDEYSITYSLKDLIINEPFLSLYTTNLTDRSIKKGELITDLIPVEPYSIEQIWAQIGYRLNFLEYKKIQFNLYHIDNTHIDLSKNLPQLPYKINLTLTLKEIMHFADKEFIPYQRETFLFKKPKLTRTTIN